MFLIREKSDCTQECGDNHSCAEARKQDEKKLSHGETCQGESWDVVLPESETWGEEDVTGKTACEKTAEGKPHAPSKSDCQGRPEAEKIEWSHNLQVSPATFFIIRKQYSRSSGRSTDENTMTL